MAKQEAPRGAVPIPPRREPVRLKLPTIPAGVRYLVPRIVALVLLLVALLGGAREVFRNWPVADIELVGRFDVIDPYELAEQLLWLKSENYFTLDVYDVYRQLRQEPMVASLAVRKQWPSSLQILIYEDVPVALWNDATVLMASGRMVEPPSRLDTSSLLKLYGADPVQSDSLRIFKRLQQALGNYGIQVVSMRVNPVLSVDATLSNGWVVRLGRQYFDERMQRLIALLGVYKAGEISQVDLRYGKGAAIRWSNTGETG